ncbi:hypothetical protein NEOLEDRAFT_1241304 [Neolentinus lepideus HHB14362 ss-1]|uniref:Mixed lineage kinase domain-containing protein n=1 Tax=Neolentinus lepideus HHB14362 ss-1 TaxID=1314782 RepID=A0A165T2W8_9AGAM|nr:hypothetical protein NEOLEDRAFT_1241304 [Neolentinus lepideus HHB14362 ss-1]
MPSLGHAIRRRFGTSKQARQPANSARGKQGRRKRSSALDAASAALTILRGASKDAQIPGLSIAIGIAQKIVDRAQQAKSNKDDCLPVVERICGIIEALVDATRGKTLAEMDESLVRDIDRFAAALEDIRVDITKLSSRSVWKRLTTANDDKLAIKDCIDKLQAARGRFDVSMHTGTRIVAIALMHGQQALRPTLIRVEDQLEQTIDELRAELELVQKRSGITAADTAFQQKEGAVQLKLFEVWRGHAKDGILIGAAFFFFNNE